MLLRDRIWRSLRDADLRDGRLIWSMHGVWGLENAFGVAKQVVRLSVKVRRFAGSVESKAQWFILVAQAIETIERFARFQCESGETQKNPVIPAQVCAFRISDSSHN